MNRNQFFSIFIAVIMLGSTIGFALVSMQNNPDTPNNNGDEPPVQPPTEIRFVAPGVESEIVELLPSIRILGTTENLNINDLDSQIYNISGVRNVASKFSNETGQITYVATVSFEPEYSSQEMFESIEASGLFESLIGFSFALVELPQKILFESENSELGLTREYEFADNFSNAIVGLESIKGDKLKVDISATFLGTELADIFAYEAENITATPIWGDTKLDLEVASLEKEILFAATVFASNALTKDSLESELETIADVNSVEINFPSIAPKIFVSSASAWEDSKVHDFNIFLQGIEHQRADIFNDTEFFVEIVFDTDSNLLDAKQAIEAQISAMGAEASVEENSDEILGSLFLLTVDSAKAALALEELLSANAFGEITIKQIGRLGLAELTDANTSTAYAVPNNEIDATLNTGHLIGDSVSAEITYSVVRGEIGYIRAVEETIE